jgi:hypothetical protein
MVSSLRRLRQQRRFKRSDNLANPRNLGAHDAEDDVTEEDVPIILDFLEAILEYLYVATAKIAAVQARLSKTQAVKRSDQEMENFERQQPF